MKKILVCDDHELFAESICIKLSGYNFNCQYTTKAEECKTLISSTTYDYFLCDFELNGSTAIDLINGLLPFLTKTRTYIISGYTEFALIERAKALQLSGYISKHISTNELVNILNLPDNHQFTTNINKDTAQKHFIQNTNLESTPFTISLQEKKIIKLIAKGLTSLEIAKELYITKNTVDTHKRNIFSKLGLNSNAALVSFAYENNLLN